MNAREKQMVENYNLSTKHSLREVYKNPSSKKIHSFEKIKAIMNIMGGEDLRICSHNMNIYSCAFKYKNGSKLRYYTAYNIYDIDIKEE